MANIIDRLARNARKQMEYRKIITSSRPDWEKRVTANVFFLRKYAGLTLKRVGELVGTRDDGYSLSKQNVSRTMKRMEQRMRFSICHPRKSCLPPRH